MSSELRPSLALRPGAFSLVKPAGSLGPANLDVSAFTLGVGFGSMCLEWDKRCTAWSLVIAHVGNNGRQNVNIDGVLCQCCHQMSGSTHAELKMAQLAEPVLLLGKSFAEVAELNVEFQCTLGTTMLQTFEQWHLVRQAASRKSVSENLQVLLRYIQGMHQHATQPHRAVMHAED